MNSDTQVTAPQVHQLTEPIESVVQFYFDPISPFAWLAARDFGRLQAAGLQIDCRPVLFAGLLNAHGQKGPAEIPAKREYTFFDVARTAQQRGYPFEGPPSHPFNPLRPLRACIALTDAQERLRLACALLQACWEQGRDLSDLATLMQIVEEAGLSERHLNVAIEDPAIKAALSDATQAAIQKGVFGVPTFAFNGELFWGADRVDTLLWRRENPHIDQTTLPQLLQRPASAWRTK